MKLFLNAFDKLYLIILLGFCFVVVIIVVVFFWTRIPKEITVSNIHQAICNIPFLDFLTNKHMGRLNEEQ